MVLATGLRLLSISYSQNHSESHHRSSLVAIGNGTASREMEQFVRDTLAEAGLRLPIVIVSEAGASVYSASPLARDELPELDVTLRGAVSIARRVQDPLAELVKMKGNAKKGTAHYTTATCITCHKVFNKKNKTKAAPQSCTKCHPKQK